MSMFTRIAFALAMPIVMRSAGDALASSARARHTSDSRCTPLAPTLLPNLAEVGWARRWSGTDLRTCSDIPFASVRDEETKLMVLSSAKAGATLSVRLMLARLNLTAAAHDFSQGEPKQGVLRNFPMGYMLNVFSRARGRTPPKTINDLRPCVPGGGWLCIEIVRNPLDRAVSSYMFTMSNHHHHHGNKFAFAELGDACGPGVLAAECQINASFAEFARALAARAHTKNRSPMDAHFMPQVALAKHNRRGSPGVVRVPIEMMSEADGAECAPLAALQPWRLHEAEALVFGKIPAMAGHYLVKQKDTPGKSEHLPFAVLTAASATPAYDSFWTNQTFCRKVVGCLYRTDVALYVGACTDAASPLRGCGAYKRVCARELARLRGVCGLNLHEHQLQTAVQP